MGVWNKLFKKESDETNASRSAALGKLARDAKAAKLVDRAPRVKVLTALHNLKCSIALKTGNISPDIANISTTGVGFLIENIASSPEPGSHFLCDFIVEGKKITAELKCVHSNGKVLGCHFLSPTLELKGLISKYFRFEITAAHLVRIDESMLKAETEGKAVWIQGENNSGLYYVHNADRIVRFSLSFFGNRVEGGENLQLRFGQQINDSGSDHTAYMDSSTIHWDEKWPAPMIDIAMRFLAAIPYLEQKHYAAMASFIRKIPRAS